MLALAAPNVRAEQPDLRAVRAWCREGRPHKPDRGPAPHVAVLLIHRTWRTSSPVPATRELSRRGFMVLAVNPRSGQQRDRSSLRGQCPRHQVGDRIPAETAGDREGRALGPQRGGGPATSFYRAVAERGSSYCRGASKLDRVRHHARRPARKPMVSSWSTHTGCLGKLACAASTPPWWTSTIRKARRGARSIQSRERLRGTAPRTTSQAFQKKSSPRGPG